MGENASTTTTSGSGSRYYAVVPVVGGLILIVGGLATLWFDRLDVLTNPNAPRPVMVRYTSQATYDLKKRPHWIFLVSTVLFAPLLMVTSVWQKSLADNNSTINSSKESLGNDIQLFAILCGTCGVGVAASPMGHLVLGTVAHMILAGGFAAFGINYCVRVQTLASDRGNSAVATVRNVCWIIALVGAGIMIVGIYPAGRGTEKLEKHERGEEEMTPKEIFGARRNEAILAVGQVSVGTMIGISVITAAAEVGDVDVESSDNDSLIIGLVSAAAACFVFGVAYVLNDHLYVLCQKRKIENDEDEVEIVEITPSPEADVASD